jgi:hypothetical protein
MEFPTPDDPKRAPVWENYVVSQASAAALGLIPSYAHAVGVEVDRNSVTLVVQSPPGAADGDEDISDIVDELEILLGEAVEVTARVDERDSCKLSPHDGVRWFFASRP